MANEDGVNSGARNFGRLCLAMIPWALGIGFSVWLGVFLALREYHREVIQEQRAAQYTGAAERPQSKLKIEILPNSCVKITHVDVDGSDLRMYAKNECHEPVKYVDWYWQLISPNGTALKQGDVNTATCPAPMQPGDAAECKPYNFEVDDRAETLRVWTTR